MNRVTVDFSGFVLEVAGLTDELARRLEVDWTRFRVTGGDGQILRAAVSEVDEPAPDGPFRPKRMTSSLGADEARFALPEGRAEVSARGEARIVLVRGLGSTSYYAMMNLLRACLAWRLPARGAALLHAAGLALDGRAFLLVGAEGSGKTTWARIGADCSFSSPSLWTRGSRAATLRGCDVGRIANRCSTSSGPRNSTDCRSASTRAR